MPDDPSTASQQPLLNRVTVIRSYAQLVRRRIERGDPMDPDRVVATLKVIEQHADALAEALGGHHHADDHNEGSGTVS